MLSLDSSFLEWARMGCRLENFKPLEALPYLAFLLPPCLRAPTVTHSKERTREFGKSQATQVDFLVLVCAQLQDVARDPGLDPTLVP